MPIFSEYWYRLLYAIGYIPDRPSYNIEDGQRITTVPTYVAYMPTYHDSAGICGLHANISRQCRHMWPTCQHITTVQTYVAYMPTYHDSAGICGLHANISRQCRHMLPTCQHITTVLTYVAYMPTYHDSADTCGLHAARSKHRKQVKLYYHARIQFSTLILISNSFFVLLL